MWEVHHERVQPLIPNPIISLRHLTAISLIDRYTKDENGKPWHPQCYGKTLTCVQCNKTVAGATVTFENKHYHPACFKCSKCKSQLDDTFQVIGGKPVCRNCTRPKSEEERASGKPGPSGKSTRVVASGASPADVANFQARKEASDNANRAKESCKGCGKKFTATEDAVLVGSDPYHSACFTCNNCHSTLEGGYSRSGGTVLCANCALKKQGGGGPCGGCGKAMGTGKYAMAAGKQYHEDCLRCAKCKNKFLNGSFVEKGGKRESLPFFLLSSFKLTFECLTHCQLHFSPTAYHAACAS